MNEPEVSENENLSNVPKGFQKIIKDFVSDILLTFPEYTDHLTPEMRLIYATDILSEDNHLVGAVEVVYNHCREVLLDKFFDILYQNGEMFDNVEVNAQFLPGIDFKELWKCDISDKTRETIWKYLQLVLFTLVGGETDSSSFGDTAKLFEAINEDEFHTKLSDTMEQIQKLFDLNSEKAGEEAGGESGAAAAAAGISLEDLPSPEDIHEHMSTMLDGKLGRLAREIAEETAADLDIDLENTSSMNDVFQQLFRNPTKLMGIVKNVGSKLDAKMKSGDIKESELIQEAGELMNKMQNMPGMGNMQDILGKMGMPGGAGGAGGAGGKVNMGAFKAHMDQNMKQAQTRERMLRKLQERQAATAAASTAAAAASQTQPAMSEPFVFSTGETVERTPRGEVEAPKKRRRGGKKHKKKNK